MSLTQGLIGVLARDEQQVIANVFGLDTRTVSSAMTARAPVIGYVDAKYLFQRVKKRR